MRNRETRWANSPGRWLTAREKKREKRKNRADSEFWQEPMCPTGLGADSYSTAPLQLWSEGKIRELWIVVMKLDNLHHLQKADRSKSEIPLAARISRKSPTFRLRAQNALVFVGRRADSKWTVDPLKPPGDVFLSHFAHHRAPKNTRGGGRGETIKAYDGS